VLEQPRSTQPYVAWRSSPPMTAGKNAIEIVPGANGRLTPANVLASGEIIREAEVPVQVELPLETTIAVIRIACDHRLAAVGKAVRSS
jgi:ribokinase